MDIGILKVMLNISMGQQAILILLYVIAGEASIKECVNKGPFFETLRTWNPPLQSLSEHCQCPPRLGPLIGLVELRRTMKGA